LPSELLIPTRYLPGCCFASWSACCPLTLGWKITAEEGDTASPRSLPHCKVVKSRARFARGTIEVSGHKTSRSRTTTTLQTTRKATVSSFF
ncbi:hypothetical protein L209DRAFT_702509, partial [Thermothelomyces heterothallicus CBS 203.75]